MRLNRRNFLAASLSTVAATSLQTRPWYKPSLEKLRVGVVGFGGRGKGLIRAVEKSKSAVVVALADVDKKILANQNAGQTELYRTGDFRQLLDRKDIDIIVSATPNHWHAMLTVLSLQAGKHVYIEKPISHNMFESKAVVAAAEKTGKLVQCGFQNRSDTALTGFFQRLGDGEFGKVLSVQGTCYRPRKSIGKLKTPLVVPKHIDYTMWLGPAVHQDLYRPRLHYDWHWDFNTGNGDVGNQGPHEWDMMNWAMGDTVSLPTSVRAAGNRFGWEDAGNTPNVMAVAGIKDSIPFTFEVMDLKPGCKPPQGQGVGVIVNMEKGKFIGGRGGGRFVSSQGKIENFKRTAEGDPTNDHMQNFFDAILSGNREMLRSDCKHAANSCSMAHMANISYRLASAAGAESVSNAYQASDLETEMIKRLIKAPAIFRSQSTGSGKWNLGPELKFDNQTSQFEGDLSGEANRLQARQQYQNGFEFPQV